MRRPDHRSVGAPQDVIGAEAVQQIPDEDSIPRRIRPHHPCQGAELGVYVFDLRRLCLSGELGFPRKSAVKSNKIEVGKSGGRPRQIVGVAILFDKQPRQALVHADILDAMPAQYLEQRIGVLLVIEDPAAGIRPRRIELQPVDLDRLTLVDQRFGRGGAIGWIDSPEDADARRRHRADQGRLARWKKINAIKR